MRHAMRKITFFLLGTAVGLAICILLVYLSGIILEYMGIQLYESEADQQRNFNIVLVVAVIASVFGGLFFAKKLS